jgi:hypothetical protein
MNPEQLQAAWSIIDRAVSRLDCKGLTLIEARDLITAMQYIGQHVQAQQPKQESIATEAPPKP